jgi:hypothetical protein
MSLPAILCGRCGAPLKLASRSDPEHAAEHFGSSTLVADIERYLAASAHAQRCASEWRRRVDVLKRAGFGPHSTYVSERAEFLLDADGIAEIDRHFQQSLDEARGIHARWHDAAAKVELAQASKEVEAAWSDVDAIDVDALYSTGITDLREAWAMLMLVREAGWSGADIRDHAAAIHALEGVIRFVEHLLLP